MRNYKKLITHSVFFITILYFLPLSDISQGLVEIQRFGDFTSASSFHVNNYGNIFIADDVENEVYKYSADFEREALIGGYGWSIESFDQPVDVFANTLNVYITDKNNNRLQIFDKDLNFLSVFPSSASEGTDPEFNYPEAAEESPLGEIFVLDSDNSRILKYDLKGDFTAEIGGYDAGAFALEKPSDFAITDESKIIVVDNNWLKIFDRFGNGLQKIDAGMKAKSITYNDGVALTTDGKILKAFSVTSAGIESQIELLSAAENETFVEAAISKNKLLVLTQTEIIVFEILNPLF